MPNIVDELKRLFELVNELPEGSPEQQEAWMT